MKRFGWSFHTVKQLVTHDVRINFCPSQAPKYKIQGLWWIWQAGLADSCVGLQKNDLLSVCVHVPGRGGRGFWSAAPQTEDRDTEREQGIGRVYMRVQQAKHAFSRISGALRLSAGLFPPFRIVVYFSGIKWYKKKYRRKKRTRFQRNKDKGSLSSFGFLKIWGHPWFRFDLPDLLQSGQQAQNLHPPSAPLTHSWKPSRCCFNEISPDMISRSEAGVLISPCQTHILIFLLWTVTIILHVHKITLYIWSKIIQKS